MKTNGNWARLDGGFHSHPKTLAVGNDGAGLLARAISYCADHLTDGFVPDAWARSAATPIACRKLVSHELWRVVDGGYMLCDFLDYNPSRSEMEEERERKRQAGLRGAEKRWGHSRPNGRPNGTSYSSGTGRPTSEGIASASGSRDATVRKKEDQEQDPRTSTRTVNYGDSRNGAGAGSGVDMVTATDEEEF